MNTRNWNVLCWNIRGLNASDKHDAVRNKIEESGCSIVCLQETKIQSFEFPLIKKFAPKRFDKFDFVPSIGASSGLLILWNSVVFSGSTIDKCSFGLTITFTSLLNSDTWKLTSVYGPCQDPARTEFVHWLKSHTITSDENWLFLGDFNFYRSLEDRNKLGGNVLDTLIFNDVIGHLGLVELPLNRVFLTDYLDRTGAHRFRFTGPV